MTITDPRLFIEATLAAGEALTLSPPQAHYLGNVMRRSPGATIRLFNGQDGEWRARLTDLRRDKARAVVEERLRPQLDEVGIGSVDIWLVFALLKRDATDLVVQKATELGVARLLPVITVRTNAGRVNEARLAAIATEAAEQSERLTVPTVQPVQPLEALLDAWPPDRLLFAAVERSPALAPLYPARGAAGLLVGPEGGFTRPELDGLAGRPFVRRVQLGSRVLRAETACLAGLTLLQAPGCGEYGNAHPNDR